MVLLSKSKYILGLSCPRQLWLKFHQLQTKTESEQTQYIMDQGVLVGKEAQKLFSDGITLDENFTINLSEAKQAIAQRKTVFEPGMMIEQLYARADVLVPVEESLWDIVEVKSSTKVKEEHYQDVSFQKYVYEKAGINIRKCFLLHINRDYVKHGAIDYNALFIQEDITEGVESSYFNGC